MARATGPADGLTHEVLDVIILIRVRREQPHDPHAHQQPCAFVPGHPRDRFPKSVRPDWRPQTSCMAYFRLSQIAGLH